MFDVGYCEFPATLEGSFLDGLLFADIDELDIFIKYKSNKNVYMLLILKKVYLKRRCDRNGE